MGRPAWLYPSAGGRRVPAPDPWPVLDRYKEHDIELPLVSLEVSPQEEQRLAEALEQTLNLGNGVVIVATEAGAKGQRKSERLFFTVRECPSCVLRFE